MRKLARQMAHNRMEMEGRSQVNREHFIYGKRQPSFFSQNWRKYAVTPKAIKEACAKEQAKMAEKRRLRNARRLHEQS